MLPKPSLVGSFKNGLNTRSNAHFLQHILKVKLHGSLADEESFCNVSVSQYFSYLSFAQINGNMLWFQQFR